MFPEEGLLPAFKNCQYFLGCESFFLQPDPHLFSGIMQQFIERVAVGIHPLSHLIQGHASMHDSQQGSALKLCEVFI